MQERVASSDLKTPEFSMPDDSPTATGGQKDRLLETILRQQIRTALSTDSNFMGSRIFLLLK